MAIISQSLIIDREGKGSYTIENNCNQTKIHKKCIISENL